jgi:hypothetical protein
LSNRLRHEEKPLNATVSNGGPRIKSAGAGCAPAFLFLDEGLSTFYLDANHRCLGYHLIEAMQLELQRWM